MESVGCFGIAWIPALRTGMTKEVSFVKTTWVYILASKPYGTLYVGVTSELVKRIYQRR